MPLKKSPSKKAFEHNLKTELHEGKPMDQSLAIAYSMKRNAKRKKMAEGGTVGRSHAQALEDAMNADGDSHPAPTPAPTPAPKKPRTMGEAFQEGIDSIMHKKSKPAYAQGGRVNESAKTEHRPGTQEEDHDAHDIAQNSHEKMPQNTKASDSARLAKRQAGHGFSVKPSRPKMVGSDAFSARLRSEVDEEEHLIAQERPAAPTAMPPRRDDEEEERHTSRPPDHAKQHNNGKPAHLAKGGHVGMEYGKGPEHDEEPAYPAGITADDEELSPPEHEFMADHMEMLAEGGMAHEEDEQPEEEEELDHDASIASAIMAKHRRMMAQGGQVDLDENGEEEPNEFYHLNEHEALDHDSVSEVDDMHDPLDSDEHGDAEEADEENDHDKSVVSKIMHKMKKRSPISR